jgi:hypothetical protein
MKTSHLKIIILGILGAVLSGPSSGVFGQASPKGSTPAILYVMRVGVGSASGHTTYFEVTQSGSPVAERELGPGRSPNSFSLPEGAYELHSYVRKCNGSCNDLLTLGPPRLECHESFKIKAGKTMYAVRNETGETKETACELKISSSRPGQSPKSTYPTRDDVIITNYFYRP